MHNRTQQDTQNFFQRIREDTSAWKNYMYRQGNIKCVYQKQSGKVCVGFVWFRQWWGKMKCTVHIACDAMGLLPEYLEYNDTSRGVSDTHCNCRKRKFKET